MHPGYVLFIQMCSIFWKDPKNKTIKQKLLSLHEKYQFLGICASLWRFMPLPARQRWFTEAYAPKINQSELIIEITTLANITISALSRKGQLGF